MAWEKQITGYAINAAEDFTIEIHMFLLSTSGVVQIKDFVIIER